MDEALPKALRARYELRAELGQGRFGTVCLAFDSRLQREVTLKIVPLSIHSDVKRRLRLEATAGGALKHPTIAATYDSIFTEDSAILVQCYVEGIRLDSYVGQEQLATNDILRQFRLIAEAVDYMHGRGLLHNDLNPANVIVTLGGLPTLIDLGSVCSVSDQERPITQDALGTPAFIAPEVVQGSAPSVASDVYSLGALLWFWLVGRPPFAGNVNAVLRQAAEDSVPSLRKAGVDASRRLEAVVAKGCHRQRSMRYSSVRDFIRDIEALQHDLPLSAQGHSAARIALWAKRKPLAAMLLASALCIAVMGTFVSALGWHRTLSEGERLDRHKRRASLEANRSATIAADLQSVVAETKRKLDAAKHDESVAERARQKAESDRSKAEEKKKSLQRLTDAAENAFKRAQSLLADRKQKELQLQASVEREQQRAVDNESRAYESLREAVKKREWEKAVVELERLDNPAPSFEMRMIRQAIKVRARDLVTSTYRTGAFPSLLAFSPSSRWLLDVKQFGTVAAIDLNSSDNALLPLSSSNSRPSRQSSFSVAFDADEARVAVAETIAGGEARIIVYQLDSAAVLGTCDVEGFIHAIRVINDRTFSLVSQPGQVILLQTEIGQNTTRQLWAWKSERDAKISVYPIDLGTNPASHLSFVTAVSHNGKQKIAVHSIGFNSRPAVNSYDWPSDRVPAVLRIRGDELAIISNDEPPSTTEPASVRHWLHSYQKKERWTIQPLVRRRNSDAGTRYTGDPNGGGRLSYRQSLPDLVGRDDIHFFNHAGKNTYLWLTQWKNNDQEEYVLWLSSSNYRVYSPGLVRFVDVVDGGKVCVRQLAEYDDEMWASIPDVERQLATVLEPLSSDPLQVDK